MQRDRTSAASLDVLGHRSALWATFGGVLITLAPLLALASPTPRPSCPEGHERAFERHAGMGLSAHFCLRDGVRNGPYWIERLGGGLRLRQTFIAGKLGGQARTWHTNGQLASVGGYVDGLPHGRWQRFNERGKPIADFVMQRGAGTWIDAWDNGALRARGPMVNGERHGTWVQWRPSGKLRTIGAFLRGDRHGVWQLFNRSGQPNGTIVYDRGSGLEVRWHDDGALQSRGWVKRGQREGPWRWWHDNGARSLQATYANGRMHGVVVGWHRNGFRASEQRFEDGKEHGVERRFTAKGVMLIERRWVAGQPHGKALYFDHLGTLRAATCFDNGRIVVHHSDLELAPNPRVRKRLLSRARIDKATTAWLADAARNMRCQAPIQRWRAEAEPASKMESSK